MQRSPLTAGLVIGSMALGIGAGTTLAGLADAILFHPLPIARPSEVVRVFTASFTKPFGYVSYPDFLDFRATAAAFSQMTAQAQIVAAVASRRGARPCVREGLAVTPDYFDVLGVRPALGRGFSNDEERAPVVVLSFAYWRAEFGGDPRVIGSSVWITGAPFTVIGVAPQNFALDRFLPEDFYIPIGIYPLADRAARSLNVFGRLKRGVEIRDAQAELSLIARRLEQEHPETNRERRAVAMTEMSWRLNSDPVFPPLARMLLIIALIMLSIAAANVAGLLKMEGESRVREMAIRAALGANPAMLFRQLAVEAAITAGAGGALGLGMAAGGMRWLAAHTTAPSDFGFRIAARMDLRVAALAALFIMTAALVATFQPWFSVSRLTPASSGSRALRRVIVVAQVGLAALLVVTGGLIEEGLQHTAAIDPGFRTDHILLATLDPSQLRYSTERTRRFYKDLLNRVRSLPGVRSAVLAQSAPLGFSGSQREITMGDRRFTFWMNVVTPGYFEQLKMPMLGGRAFRERDTAEGSMVAVINDTMAALLPQGQAIGGQFQMGDRVFHVIGVVKTAKYFRMNETPRCYFYVPFDQVFVPRMTLQVETAGDPLFWKKAVEGVVNQLDSGQPLSDERSLFETVSQSALFVPRLASRITDALALCGLALALAGLYGMVASSMERRRKEMAVRVAIGASRFRIVALIVREGASLALIGLLPGFAAAFALVRLFRGLLIEVNPLSMAVYAGSAIMLMAASLAPCLIAAIRGARADPMAALRNP